MSDPTMNSPDNGAQKRKRTASEELGPDPQRLNRSSHGSNGSMENQHNFAHGGLGNYDHGLPNTGSELNIDQQILQHVGTQNGLSDDNALTANAKAALAAHTPQHKYPPPPDAGFDASNLTSGLPQGMSFGDEMNQQPMGGGHNHSSTAAAVYAAREAQSMNQKPTVGSPEWHQVRKNNHKEVERRRREAINEGINRISHLVPNCDKNKGAILQRAIEYIQQLQEEKKIVDEQFEKHSLTAGHAINEISNANAKLKSELARRNNIALKWLTRCRDAGLEFDDYEESKELESLETE
ncbi:hypothetical protein N7535_002948 [Penicillium sp. DV-2018c]|nr:hypothetical protein N7461_001366 [Penicillium sp. DV-2018c]KAJ5576022.1 hypothetical protein N7535_002948 [Penicillium sp. DV-2018c]